MIDRKLEPLVKKQMIKYLGELEDDDLVMFVLEHLKDHKGPQKLIEGLEPVRLHHTRQHSLSNHVFAGSGRGSQRTRHRCMATSYLREYGLRRRFAYRAPDGGLVRFPIDVDDDGTWYDSDGKKLRRNGVCRTFRRT